MTKSVSKIQLNKHEQYCIGVLTLAQNGAKIEDLLPLLEEMTRQAEELLC